MNVAIEIRLTSHRDNRAVASQCRVLVNEDHCRLEFNTFWHTASTAMSHDELRSIALAIDDALDQRVVPA
jgi:hypothetical protein